MAKEVLELEVKSNVSEVTKDAASAVGEFQVMGVSINSIKAGFASMGRTAKASFATIKAGIMSTGIGALVIAVGSLITFFTKTKKGAELVEVAFAGVGAAVNVIIDRVSKFGGAIVKLFQGDAKGALQDVKGAFKGIGEEIANDTKEAIKLKQAFVDLRDSERDLNVETAQRRAEIEKLKLIAEDVTKEEGVRLKAAQDAFNIENDLLNRRITNAKEALRIQREEMELGENRAEDLDKEAELEINLANIIGESTTKQIELNNKINAIKAEILAKRKEEEVVMTEMPRLAQESADGIIQADNAVLENYINNIDARKQLTKDLEDFKYETAHNGLRLIQVIAGEGTALAKSAAIAQATLSGVQGVQNAFTSAAANIPLTAATGGAYPYIQAGFAGAFSLAQIAKLMSGTPADGGASVPATTAATPAPQMMSGAFDLTGGVAPDPLKAFVVTDEMTNSQDQLANIRRRATI